MDLSHILSFFFFFNLSSWDWLQWTYCMLTASKVRL